MNPGLLVGAGFLLGSVGVKALTSNKAKQVYVKGIVQGMRAKEEVQTMVDEARAEFDDLLLITRTKANQATMRMISLRVKPQKLLQ